MESRVKLLGHPLHEGAHLNSPNSLSGRPANEGSPGTQRRE